MAEDKIRVLRLLEYVGSRSFVERSLERRSIKGRFYPSRDLRSSDYIQEAILGEIAEILPPPDDLSLTIDELTALSNLTAEGKDWKPVDLLNTVSDIVRRLMPRDEDGVSEITGDINA